MYYIYRRMCVFMLSQRFYGAMMAKINVNEFKQKVDELPLKLEGLEIIQRMANILSY